MSMLDILTKIKEIKNKLSPWLVPHWQLGLAICLGVIAFGAAGYWALSLVDRTEQIAVVVAKRDLTAPYNLTSGDVGQTLVPRQIVPKTAVANISDIIGLTLRYPVSAGQVITINELTRKEAGLEGYQIPSGLKGVVVPASWLSGPIPKLKKGDTITLIVSGVGTNGTRNTGVLESGIPVLELEPAGEGAIQKLLVGLNVGTALKLLQLRANNLLIQVLLDSLSS